MAKWARFQRKIKKCTHPRLDIREESTATYCSACGRKVDVYRKATWERYQMVSTFIPGTDSRYTHFELKGNAMNNCKDSNSEKCNHVPSCQPHGLKEEEIRNLNTVTDFGDVLTTTESTDETTPPR